MTEAPAVAVVAFGDPSTTLAALRHLAAPDDALVVVADNSDSTVLATHLREHGIVYVSGHGNVGFARGVNLALQRIPSGRDVLLLNPDSELGWDGVVALQTTLHESPRTAAVAPRLVNPDGSPQQVLWPVPSPAGTWLDAAGIQRRGPWFLSGAVLLLSGAALEQLGWFDERYFLYAEETDWQMRALRAGWTLRVADHVVAMHHGGGTSTDEARRVQLLVRSALSLQEKWYGRAGAWVSWAGSMAAATRRSLVSPAAQRRRGRLMLATLARTRP